MRVAVDARSLRAPGTGRGIAVYLERLLAEMARLEPRDRFETVTGGRLASASAAVAGRPRLDRSAGGCDVAWAPAPAPLAVSPEVPLVLTVHDLSFEHRPEDYGAYERVWHRLARPRRLAERAARAIAVSEAVRAELISEWGLDPERVTTVLSGPGRPPERAGPLPPGLSPGFVLAVGALEPRKRPDLLMEAHRRARERGLRAELVFAGEGSPPRDAGGRRAEAVAPGDARGRRAEAVAPGDARGRGTEAVAPRDARGRRAEAVAPRDARGSRTEAVAPRFLGRVDDSTLEALYAGALVLACPSREEGFGFTPLEAAARGTPAIVADLAPFRETLGDGALAVPPDDPDALADALLRLESDADLRSRLAEGGLAAAGRLSWERAARETHAVLAATAQEARP